MTTAELQIDLINRITGITDASKLEELLQLVKFQSDKTVYITNDEDKKIVAEARAEIASGKTISNEDLQSEINILLKM